MIILTLNCLPFYPPPTPESLSLKYFGPSKSSEFSFSYKELNIMKADK